MKIKILFGILLLVCGAMLGVSRAEARTSLYIVNAADDTDDGVCDSAHCSLREAINAANAGSDTGHIDFDIPGCPCVIDVSGSGLPVITDRTEIDGYSQPGAHANTLAVGNDAVIMIQLDGSGASGSAYGLDVSSASLQVQGLAIAHFDVGIHIAHSSGSQIVGNFIGVDLTGYVAQANGDGIALNDAQYTVIGRDLPAQRNVISGNTYRGIVIEWTAPRSVYNTIVNNYIGTTASGMGALGNQTGIYVGGDKTTIGGAIPAQRNLISANDNGVFLEGNSNALSGNFIGAAVNKRALGNLYGVTIAGTASENVIGGAARGAGNLIAYNIGHGVWVNGYIASNPVRNAILQNSIYSNGGLGIALSGDGVTPNDVGDADTGPNELQNYPVVVNANSAARVVKARLNSAPNTTFRVEFFSNPACDGTLYGEGKKFIGAKTVTTNGSGSKKLKLVNAKKFRAGQLITATVTDPNGNTSEFSGCTTAN